jgi:uncharacterized MAPEG superfamily protein
MTGQPYEIVVLAFGGILAGIQLVIMAIPANMQLGPDYTMSPRDEVRPLSGRAGRLHRAFQNMLESLCVYAAAAVSVVLLGASSGFTEICAGIWLGARIVYVPLYAWGAAPWRSVAFGIGFFATFAMLVAAAWAALAPAPA